MNSASLQSADGAIPSAFHCLSTRRVDRVLDGKVELEPRTGPVVGTVARNTATCPW